MNLPFDEGFELINKAFKETNNQKVWELYVSIYPHMKKENFISFDEYCKLLKTSKNEESEEEILDDVKSILG